MKYQIRPMREEDIQAVITGEMKIFNATLGFDMLYSDLTLNPYAHYFVLEIDYQVHGYCGLWISEQAEIINFYVDKEFQSLGFGKMMLEFMIRLCHMSHVQSLSLEVRCSNQRAITLYERYGFTKSHVRSHYYDDGEDAWVMIKLMEDNNDSIRS